MHQVEIATTQETLLDSPEMVLNMGPQHPSTHGVLRVILKLDGETVIDLDCDIGYLHRGMEKIAENRMYTMIAPTGTGSTTSRLYRMAWSGWRPSSKSWVSWCPHARIISARS